MKKLTLLSIFTLYLLSCKSPDNQLEFNTPKEDLPTIIKDTQELKVGDTIWHEGNNHYETVGDINLPDELVEKIERDRQELDYFD